MLNKSEISLPNFAPIEAEIYSGKQYILICELEKIDPILSIMYRGCVVGIKCFDNPDRLPQCAHSVRELMEKLPEYFNAPVKSDGNLNDKVQDILHAYNSAEKKTSCFSINQGWFGEIDVFLTEFLFKLRTFFNWFEENRPRRKVKLARLLSKMEKAPSNLPEPLFKKNVKKWDDWWNFFQSVAHHRILPEEQQFLQNLNSLEGFILDRLLPETFDDFAEIDCLIAEGEKNAK